MKLVGLKVFADKGWKPDSTFTGDDGRTMTIPANHKIICQDENNDVVNVSFVTAAPLTLKVGAVVDVSVTGNISKSAFGWSVKGVLVK